MSISLDVTHRFGQWDPAALKLILSLVSEQQRIPYVDSTGTVSVIGAGDVLPTHFVLAQETRASPIVGTVLGIFVGLREGLIVSKDVGTELGSMVGVDVGTSLESNVGAALGASVGVKLGNVLGARVGIDAGAALGVNVGIDVGSTLGSIVGGNV